MVALETLRGGAQNYAQSVCQISQLFTMFLGAAIDCLHRKSRRRRTTWPQYINGYYYAIVVTELYCCWWEHCVHMWGTIRLDKIFPIIKYHIINKHFINNKNKRGFPTLTKMEGNHSGPVYRVSVVSHSIMLSKGYKVMCDVYVYNVMIKNKFTKTKWDGSIEINQ